MSAIKLLAASICCFVLSSTAAGQDADPPSKALAAIKTMVPDKEFSPSIWTSAVGDLNGDGIQDMALVLTGWQEGGGRGERLVVLTGNPDESYTVLSISNEFCNVRHFYNLDIMNRSLFIQGFHSVDSSGASSFTLQFRYNAKLKDLELIGREDIDEKYEMISNYKVSVNYLIGSVIHSRRENIRFKEVKAKMSNSKLLKLQGFDCATYNTNEPHIYIDENFSVKK